MNENVNVWDRVQKLNFGEKDVAIKAMIGLYNQVAISDFAHALGLGRIHIEDKADDRLIREIVSAVPGANKAAESSYSRFEYPPKTLPAESVAQKVVKNIRFSLSSMADHMLVSWQGGHATTYYSIDWVLGIEDINNQTPTKKGIARLRRHRRALENAISKIDSYCARYVPKEGKAKPCYRVKAVSVRVPPVHMHASDCAVNNGPALPVGPCNC